MKKINIKNQEYKMIRLALLFVLILLQSMILSAQEFDVNTKPEPLPEKEFKFPDYRTVELENGLKLFLIEDKEQPTIALRMMLSGGNSVDTLKPGTAELLTSLLTKGAGKLNALQIAEKLDGIGAGIDASSSTDYISIESSGLIKHFDIILDIYSKIILEPTFPESEFKKLIPQIIAGIQQEKGDPRSLANKLGKKVVFGENHPYSLYPTEESVNSINIKDIKSYYSSYFLPNNATIAIIGDFDSDEMTIKIRKYFGEWKKGKLNPINMPPIQQLPIGVYFIERPSSVQSTISLNFRTIPYGTKDFEKLSLATMVVSGGFAGRLFQTLREKHSYTYTPFGSQSQYKFFGRYFCGADVKNSVTDSALNVTFEQINSLFNAVPSTDEVNRVKSFQAGIYKMSYENSSFIASAIQDANFYGLPIDYISKYPQRIMALTNYDVQDAARTYLNTKKAFIVVVGSPEVKEKLTQFGKIYDYNINLEPLSGDKAKIEKISLSADDLLKKYQKALGGLDKINSVRTIIDTAIAIMISKGIETKGRIVQYQKAPNLKYFVMEFDSFKQEVWVDGQNAWVRLNEIQKIDFPDAEKYIYDATLFKDTKLLRHCFTQIRKSNNLMFNPGFNYCLCH